MSRRSLVNGKILGTRFHCKKRAVRNTSIRFQERRYMRDTGLAFGREIIESACQSIRMRHKGIKFTAQLISDFDSLKFARERSVFRA